MKFSRVLAVAAIALMPIWGMADTVTSTSVTKSFTSGSSIDLTVDQYSGVYTLQSVSITLTYYINGYTWSFTATDSSAVVSNLETDVRAKVSLAGTALYTTYLYTATDDGGDVDFADGYSVDFGDVGGTTLAYTLSSVSSSFGSFIGTGTVTLTVALKELFAGYFGNAELEDSFSGGTISATVTYTYVPEPSTYALILGAGTLALVGYRRFRRK